MPRPDLNKPIPDLYLSRHGVRQWDEHYCGQRHNPKYPCPPPAVEFGGFPVNQLKPCYCAGLEHDADCPRRRSIKSLYNRRTA